MNKTEREILTRLRARYVNLWNYLRVNYRMGWIEVLHYLNRLDEEIANLENEIKDN